MLSVTNVPSALFTGGWRMHPVNEFLDVISVDTAFPLIRTENGPKFKSGPTRTIVSKTENEANIFLKLLSHHLHFDLKDFLGSHFFLPPPATASAVHCNMRFFSSLAQGVTARHLKLSGGSRAPSHPLERLS